MSSTRVFWGIFTALTAIAAHLCYVLFVPSSQLQSRLDAIISETGINTLTIARKERASFSMAEFPAELVYAVCPFDLENGSLRLLALIPDQYWAFEVFDGRGNAIYTLNDQQAPRRNLQIFLHNEDPGPQAIVEAANAIGNKGDSIAVLTGSRTGVIVLRTAGATTLERTRAHAALSGSSCALVSG